MHVASSSEFFMAPAMFQNSRERLRGTTPGKLVRGRTKNWIGEARQLGRACSKCDRALNIRASRQDREPQGPYPTAVSRAELVLATASPYGWWRRCGTGVIGIARRFFFKCDFSHNRPGSRGTNILTEKLHFINQNDRGRPIVKIRAICSI